jgi:ferrous iron transport protein B
MLEESGYMSRVVFMFDSIMQRFGMNGRSMVSLISSGACAIPAIMATRTITHPRERLITILVSPLISCSARLPVYAVLVGFVVPHFHWLGIFDYRGLALMGLYLLGLCGALLSAFLAKQLIRAEGQSFLMMELPNYQAPIWKNVFLVVWEKVASFILNAGKIIIIISVALWFLASYGLPGTMKKAEEKALAIAKAQQLSPEAATHLAEKLPLSVSSVKQ